MQYSINELNSTITKSPLFLERFIPKEKSCYTYCLPDSSPPSSSVSPGRLRNKVPSSSFLLNKNIVLFDFIFPPLHLTLPYSAHDPGAMGSGTHWPWIIMSFHTAEIDELHTSLVVVLQLFGFVAVHQNAVE